MKQELQEMKQVQQDMQSKLQDIEAKGEERYQEVLDRFKALEIDRNFIWKKPFGMKEKLLLSKGNLVNLRYYY